MEKWAKLRHGPPLCKLGIRLWARNHQMLGEKWDEIWVKTFFFALHLILGKKWDEIWVWQFQILIYVSLEFSEVSAPLPPPFQNPAYATVGGAKFLFNGATPFFPPLVAALHLLPVHLFFKVGWTIYGAIMRLALVAISNWLKKSGLPISRRKESCNNTLLTSSASNCISKPTFSTKIAVFNQTEVLTQIISNAYVK